MPFKRPTLTEQRQQVIDTIKNNLSTGSLLRFSNMAVICEVQAGMNHLNYGYLDYIYRQSNPFTATDESLEAWAALKQIYRQPLTAASGFVKFTGSAGRIIPKNTIVKRSDGQNYETLNESVIDNNGQAISEVRAILPDQLDDLSGGGSNGNAEPGTFLSLEKSLVGIDSRVVTEQITGGSDIENDDSLRSRMLLAYQNISNGGSDLDYHRWALDVAGVTRVWVRARGYGANTVVVYIMCDSDAQSNNGFPVGSDGVSQYEEWPEKRATGDQARVADHIFRLQPVTSLVYIVSPIAKKIDFKISGIQSVTEQIKTSINNAINRVFFTVDLAGRVPVSQIISSIADIPGADGFVLEQPISNITLGIGELPIIGSITFL